MFGSSWSAQAATWTSKATGWGAGLGWQFTQADFERCLNALTYTTWMQWNYCVDLTSYALQFKNSAKWDKYSKSMSTTFRTGKHEHPAVRPGSVR
jgi:hypothetical protein